MSQIFAETLRRLRMEKSLSQQQFADRLFVDRSSVASWETGRRMPDAMLIARIAETLDVEVSFLLGMAERAGEKPNVIMVDDEKIAVTGGMPVLEKVMPGANIEGFTNPLDAVEFVKHNKVALAFMDIEMGKISGLDICRRLLSMNPRINVVYMTAYMEYSFDAWDTGACGFLLKSLSAEAVGRQLGLLRYPVPGLMPRDVEKYV